MDQPPKHSPSPWTADFVWYDMGNGHLVLYVHTQNETVCQLWLAGSDRGLDLEARKRETEANARLIIAAPRMLAEMEATAKAAVDLMERAARIDALHLKAQGEAPECELGEVVRLRQQLGRNRAAIEGAPTEKSIT